ncbi:alpha/beta hydrolase [Streptomyces sp. NPDC048290]|uniref:alpha/beta fold hydrolase n=1 Tax=Streptomyces sp. NPDC048290 TaxID=3155811 RepID=UPI003419460A
MSRPPSLTPPPAARAYPLHTARGDFAVVDHPVAPGVEPRGTALLLPGFTGSKEDFRLLHAPLAARGYRTVAVDGRGQYESDGPVHDEAPYAQPELARDVLAQAAALGTPLHLFGHSLGGQIARAAVLLEAPAPASFRSLTLMSSGPAQISGPQQERVKLLRDALAVMSMAEVWEAIESMDAPEDIADPAVGEDHLRVRWLGNKPAQLIATGRQLCVEPDRVAELAAVPLPYHVLSGATDGTWPLPLLDDMAVRLHARRTVVADADHSPNIDQPLPTAEAVADFWDTVPIE